MGVRLNKVLSELNIGLQTAVDFLKKKKEKEQDKKKEEAPKVEVRQQFKPLGKMDLDNLN